MYGLEEKDEEEFNNFMSRVTQIEKIIKNMNHPDKNVQAMADIQAEEILADGRKGEDIDVDNIHLKVKSSKTLINKNALKDEPNDPNTMSQDAFMREVERDANKRHKEKMIRKERSDTFKTQATKAFRRGEYEKALCLYDKAIEQIKDSPLLYTNRAIVQIQLKRYDKAVEDTELALRLNENSLKASLLLAKALCLNGNNEKFQNVIAEAKTKHPQHLETIDEYVEKFTIADKND